MNRPRPWLALLVSALAHVCVALILLAHGGRVAGPYRGTEQPGRALMVRLVQPVPAAAPGSVPVLAETPAADAPVPLPSDAESLASGARSSNPAPEPHYFDVGALTQAPVLRSGMAAQGRMMIVPGITPQTIALQVWISDEGTVDRIVLDTPLSDAEHQKLLAAFAKVRFSPGRLGRIAVRSQKRMEISLDFELHS